MAYNVAIGLLGEDFMFDAVLYIVKIFSDFFTVQYEHIQESPANAKGTRDSSACMKAHCEQM